MFIPTRRATVLVPSGTPQQPDLKHLFILLTDPRGEPKFVIIVSISSRKPNAHYDPTCPLFIGDHPFINRESFVAYRTAKFIEVSKLMNGVARGILIPRDPIDGGVFARICQGVIDSRFTAKDIKDAYIAYTMQQP